MLHADPPKTVAEQPSTPFASIGVVENDDAKKSEDSPKPKP